MSVWKLISILCIISVSLVSLAAGEDEVKDTLLSAAKLQEVVMDSNDPWLLLFQPSPSSDMAGDFSQIKEKLAQYNMQLGLVDCSQKEHKKVCQALGPRVPSLQLVVEAPTLNPYTKKNYRKSVPFDGATVDLSSLERFIGKNFPNHVGKVSELSQLEEKLSKKRPTVLLFSDKEVVSMLYKSIALQLSNKFEFVHVMKSAKEVAEKYSVQSLPALLVVDADKVEKFSPEDKADYKSRSSLVSWLTSLEVSAPAVDNSNNNQGSGKEDASTQSNSNSSSNSRGIKQLDSKFSIDSVPGDESWVILVHAKDDVAVVSDWDKTRRWCEGKIVAAELACHQTDLTSASLLVQALCSQVNADDADSHFHFVVPYGSSTSSRKKLVPTDSMDVKTYNSKLSAHKFSGSQSDQARRAAADSLPDHAVRYIDGEASLQNFLGDANGQSLISAIVISDKESPPAFLRNVALTAAKVAKVGFMHGLAPSMSKMIGTPSLPTMVCFFSAPSSSTLPAGQLQIGVYDVNAFGPMKLGSLVTFISYVYQQSGYKETNPIEEDPSVKKQREMGLVSGTVQNAVITVNSNSDWETHCGDKFKGVCAVALTGSDADNDQNVISSAMKLMGSAGAAFKFLAADGDCFQSFSTAFEVDQVHLPTVVAFSPSKLRFATYRGAYTDVSHPFLSTM
jgi:hypothetical protein